MNELRLEFQDQVNFVILDWDIPEEKAFGMGLGFSYHPNFATLEPNSNEVVDTLFAAPRGNELRDMIESVLAEHGDES